MIRMVHIPLRMCIACREHKPLQELIRITYNDRTNTPEPDRGVKNTGRGVYVCKDIQCIRKARKKNVLERHLKCEPSDALYTKLEEMI